MLYGLYSTIPARTITGRSAGRLGCRAIMLTSFWGAVLATLAGTVYFVFGDTIIYLFTGIDAVAQFAFDRVVAVEHEAPEMTAARGRIFQRHERLALKLEQSLPIEREDAPVVDHDAPGVA